MAKVSIEFEDNKDTTTGGWLKFAMKVDPPFEPDADDMIDYEKLTPAQILANEVAGFIKEKITHSVLKGGAK